MSVDSTVDHAFTIVDIDHIESTVTESHTIQIPTDYDRAQFTVATIGTPQVASVPGTLEYAVNYKRYDGATTYRHPANVTNFIDFIPVPGMAPGCFNIHGWMHRNSAAACHGFFSGYFTTGPGGLAGFGNNYYLFKGRFWLTASNSNPGLSWKVNGGGISVKATADMRRMP